MDTLQRFAEWFNHAFLESLGTDLRALDACSSDPSVAATYRQALHIAAAGGKRTRPFVAAALYRATADSTHEEITDVLFALEIFHLFALVHDDIMDGAEERHGQATIHAAVRGRLSHSGATGDARAVALAEAILVGDYLLSLVHDYVLRARRRGTISHERCNDAEALLAQMSREVVIGQHLDIELTTRSNVRERDILDRHHLKTALYTFVRPMQIGAVLGGGGAEVLRFCEDVGSALGKGFQLEDDLLDLLAEEAELGKMPGADLSQRQHTLLTAELRQRGTQIDIALLESFWGHPLSPSQLQQARDMFIRCGAVDSVRSRAQGYFDHARTVLTTTPFARRVPELMELLLFLERRLP